MPDGLLPDRLDGTEIDSFNLGFWELIGKIQSPLVFNTVSFLV